MGVCLNIAKIIIEDRDGTISAANNSEGAVFEIVFKKNEES